MNKRLQRLNALRKKRLAEAMQFLLLILALMDGALISESLSIFRAYIESSHPESLWAYITTIIIVTAMAIFATWSICKSWIKPLNEVEDQIKTLEKRKK